MHWTHPAAHGGGRAEARATHPRFASTKSAKRFVINLVRACKVMLTRNVADKGGLANGTRVVALGVVYGQEGVGSGSQSCVVEVPDYVGAHLARGESARGCTDDAAPVRFGGAFRSDGQGVVVHSVGRHSHQAVFKARLAAPPAVRCAVPCAVCRP